VGSNPTPSAAPVQRIDLHADDDGVGRSIREAVLGGWPPRDEGARRDLVAVAAASLGLLAAIAAAVRFVGLLVERSDALSLLAPFGGWQLAAVEAAIGAVVLAVGSCTAITRRRRASARARCSARPTSARTGTPS
jgi:hypothetical protein